MAFLANYNGIALESPEIYDERAAEGKNMTQQLADDTQVLIVAWDRVDTPLKHLQRPMNWRVMPYERPKTASLS